MDTELTAKAQTGANNFAQRNFRPGQNVLILSDQTTWKAGMLLQNAAEEIIGTGRVVLLNLDEYQRPIDQLDQVEHLALLASFQSSQIILYITQEHDGEQISLKQFLSNMSEEMGKQFMPMRDLTLDMLAGF